MKMVNNASVLEIKRRSNSLLSSLDMAHETDWKKAFWDLMYNKLYSPAPVHALFRELKHLKDKNEKQAAKIQELEFLLSFIRRVGDGVYITDHAKLMRLYRFYKDHKRQPVV